MPSSAVQIFTDPDEFAASVRGTTAEVTIVERGRFTAKIIAIHLHHLRMQRVSDNLARIAHAADIPGRASISFRTQPGPSLLRNGVELLSSKIVRHGRADKSSYFQRSAGYASWGTFALTTEKIASLGTIIGHDLTPPKDALSLTPPPLAMAKLQRLHAAAGRLAEDAPAVITDPEAARGLEQALIEAMIRCLGAGEAREDRAALRQHALVMRRFRREVEEKPDQALFVAELCTAIGVTERTLRMCCQEQLGMSPKRYLRLRRLHLVRRALLARASTDTTVTAIATQYGFWEFGRFAGEYKSLFEELPSNTLARPPEYERTAIV
jgi:AraC-like DNA-binding protein